jgi:hypothetical protein
MPPSSPGWNSTSTAATWPADPAEASMPRPHISPLRAAGGSPARPIRRAQAAACAQASDWSRSRSVILSPVRCVNLSLNRRAGTVRCKRHARSAYQPFRYTRGPVRRAGACPRAGVRSRARRHLVRLAQARPLDAASGRGRLGPGLFPPGRLPGGLTGGLVTVIDHRPAEDGDGPVRRRWPRLGNGLANISTCRAVAAAPWSSCAAVRRDRLHLSRR